MSNNYANVIRPPVIGYNNRSNAAAADDRPATQVYGNIGLTFEMPDPETGELVDVFIPLPLGLSIDTMRPMQVKGQNVEWNQRVDAMNWLLEHFQEEGDKLEPGEEKFFDGLRLQLKRVGTPAVTAPSKNSLLSAMKASLKTVA